MCLSLQLLISRVGLTNSQYFVNVLCVLLTAAVQECVICGRRSSWECSECKQDFNTKEANVFFCDICSERAHEKKERIRHEKKRMVNMLARELELLSVICIETSHYVCFTRDLNNEKWIFFDSMADRVGKCNFLKPQHADCSCVPLL